MIQASNMEESKTNPLSKTILFALCCSAIVFVSFVPQTFTSKASAQRSGPKVIELEEIKIEGRVQKPNAFYILNRSNLGYEVLELQTSFLPKIIKSVQKKPF